MMKKLLLLATGVFMSLSASAAPVVYNGTVTDSFTQTINGNETQYDYSLAYSITYNDEKTLTITGTYDWNEGKVPEGWSATMFITVNGIENPAPINNFSATATTAQTYGEGDPVKIIFNVPVTLGNVKPEITYTVGSTTEGGSTTDPVDPDPEQPTDPEEGNNAVWYGQTDIDGFQADWNIKFNTDRTLTFSAEMTTEKPVGADQHNVHIFGTNGNNDEWVKLYDNGSGVYVGTTTNLFTLNGKVSWEWYMPVEAGLYQQSNEYIVGSSNEAPKSIRISATVDNVTASSAEITYEVTAPEGAEYKVYYKTADTEAVEATENPIQLVNLSEKTDYAYELYAVMGDGDESVESRHITVTFKTSAENARDYVFNDYHKARFNNAYLEGEDEMMRRTIYVSLPFTITYAADETATYAIDLSEVANIVGLNPQIYWNGFRQLTKKEDSNIWEYNFGTQVLDEEVAISHYLAYNGGVIDFNLKNERVYSAWGQEKASFELGEPAAIELSASKTIVKVEDPIILTAVPTDADGYYLPANGIEYEVEGGPFELEGEVLYLVNHKGERKVTAKMGEISASIFVNAIASPEAFDIILNGTKANVTGYTDEENVIEGTVIENVTDNNPATELRWGCGTTQEHYLIYDLGEGFYIEAIDLLFEGAYATQFTVTLTNNQPAELATEELSTLAAATEDVVFQPAQNNTQHYFMQEPSGSHRYVALRTSQALNAGWGIKVKDMKVYGTYQAPSTVGVEDVVVEDANAPAEYFNLQGVRVAQPEAGNLYIVRKGTAVTKVIVR